MELGADVTGEGLSAAGYCAEGSAPEPQPDPRTMTREATAEIAGVRFIGSVLRRDGIDAGRAAGGPVDREHAQSQPDHREPQGGPGDDG